MIFGISDAVTAGLKLIDKFIPDPSAKALAEAELRKDLMSWDAMQAATNTAEAANPSVFVAGWRPFIGWICGMALAYQYVLVPIATWGAAMFHIILPVAITLDANLWELLAGMLGMAGLRTFEKVKGVSRL